MTDTISNDTDGLGGRETDDSAIELILEPKQKDLGGFSVRRLLPATEQRSVGPFIFFDHLGPADIHHLRG